MPDDYTFIGRAIDLLEDCQSILDQKGFDNVEAKEVLYRASGYKSGLQLEYTSNEPGFWNNVLYATDSNDLFLQLNDIPNRERRDLSRLAEKLAGIRDMQDTLNSVLAKGICAEIMDNARPLFAALEDKR